MADALSSVGAAHRVAYHAVRRDEGSEAVRRTSASEPSSPVLARVVGDINTVVRGMAHDLRVELDLGAGKLGARVISTSGMIRPIPLKYVAEMAAIIRYAGVESPAPGSLVDEIA